MGLTCRGPPCPAPRCALASIRGLGMSTCGEECGEVLGGAGQFPALRAAIASGHRPRHRRPKKLAAPTHRRPKSSRQQGLPATERRRNRTFQPPGYDGLPVLKTRGPRRDSCDLQGVRSGESCSAGVSCAEFGTRFGTRPRDLGSRRRAGASRQSRRTRVLSHPGGSGSAVGRRLAVAMHGKHQPSRGG